jgi:hypothetical protein
MQFFVKDYSFWRARHALFQATVLYPNVRVTSPLGRSFLQVQSQVISQLSAFNQNKACVGINFIWTGNQTNFRYSCLAFENVECFTGMILG